MHDSVWSRISLAPFHRGSLSSFSSRAGRPGCFELKRDLRVCGKVTHGALIRADKRIREIHSASVAPSLCFKCCERSENSQMSRVADKQTSRVGVSNLTRLRICVCARLCARPPSVMRHKVCLSALTRCFAASPGQRRQALPSRRA